MNLLEAIPSFTHSLRHGAGPWECDGQRDRQDACTRGERWEGMGCKTNQINNVLGFCWQLQTKPCSDWMKEDDLASDEEAKLGLYEERTLTLPPGGCKGPSRSP